MKLSIVIVSYNVKYYLEQCLVSIYRAIGELAVEIIIVDNASVDASGKYIVSRFPYVRWISNVENRGFAHANNQAFAIAKGEYILMLNPDTIIAENTLNDVVGFMDKNGNVGALGVKMLNKDGTFALESRRGLVTPWVGICKALGLNRLFPKSPLFGKYYMSYLDENVENKIEMVSGACMLLKRSVIEVVGYLDEDFFMYWEDSELSYRVLKSGADNYYMPTPIFHYKGESSIKSKLRYRYWLYHSLQIFFKKHFPVYFILSFVPVKIIINSLRFQINYANKLLYGKNWNRMGAVSPKKFVVFGKNDSLVEIEKILKNNNLDDSPQMVVATQEDSPSGHLSLRYLDSAVTHVIYDVDAYSFRVIFDLLQRGCSKGLRLATYSGRTGLLITEDAIYSNKPKNLIE